MLAIRDKEAPLDIFRLLRQENPELEEETLKFGFVAFLRFGAAISGKENVTHPHSTLWTTLTWTQRPGVDFPSCRGATVRNSAS